MTDIKPKIVDGEAVCSGADCPYGEDSCCDKTCQATEVFDPCWPYYRARVAELEAELKQYRDAPTPDQVLSEVDAAVEALRIRESRTGIQIPDDLDAYTDPTSMKGNS